MPTRPATRTRRRQAVAAAAILAAPPSPASHCISAVCRHGYPNPTVEANRDTTVPGSLSSSGYYRFPDAPEYNGCYSCSDSQPSWARMMRDYGLSTVLINAEVALNRRLTFAEACSVVDHFRNSGERIPANVASGEAGILDYVGSRMALRSASEAERQRLRALQDEQRQRDADRQASEAERAARARNASAPIVQLLATEAGRVALSAEPADPAPEVVAAHPASECECDPDYDCECGHRYGRRNTPGLRCSPEHGMPFLARKCDRNKRIVGVELEFNQITDLTPWLLKWRGAVHSDGSCGWEAVTTPMAGGHIDVCLRDLTRTLRSKGIQADERCGVHVHVDSRDVRWADMLRLIKVYAMVEPILYLLAGQQRIVQQYCRPCGPQFAAALASSDPKEAVMAVAYNVREQHGVGGSGRKYARQRPGKKDGGRYKGLNIIPWLVGRRNGAPDTTVEFRMHRNSLDGTRVAGWAKLCSAIVEYATRATDADVNALPKSALRILCDHVSPEQRGWILKRVLEWRRVTTVERRSKRSDANGTQMATRRVVLKGGAYTCAA